MEPYTLVPRISLSSELAEDALVTMDQLITDVLHELLGERIYEYSHGIRGWTCQCCGRSYRRTHRPVVCQLCHSTLLKGDSP